MATGPRYLGKVVIVTGGTSGIGLAIVREFVHQGATVVYCSRASDAERGQAIERELQDSGCPGDAHYQVCDVRNESDIKRMILATVARCGRLDCLVNNAGTSRMERIDDTSAQDFRNMIELNTVSCFLTAKYALPCLRETRGNIINIASLVGVLGQNYAVSYVSSKALGNEVAPKGTGGGMVGIFQGAVIAMTKALAIDESKYGVRVNSISPGYIETPLLEKLANQSTNPEERMRKTEESQPMGRRGTPEEVALAALYLAADATFCTGFNLVVSGGAEIGFGKKNQGGPESLPSTGGGSQDPFRKQ